MRNKKKIIAVASIGGHWIQLLRIVQPMEEQYDVVYMSTHEKCRTMVDNNCFYQLPDFNRSNVWKMPFAALKVLKVLLKERPTAIITTGAAPGLLTILVAKLFFKKTIWIDSVANVKTLSGCGHIAKLFTKNIYTQWPDLARDGIRFAGNIFGDSLEDKK
ncbi:MAG: hypothetical protein IJ905_12530 [Fibrobacter sp.]|nr:hypothetical protein [Fibrobacter sp.]